MSGFPLCHLTRGGPCVIIFLRGGRTCEGTNARLFARLVDLSRGRAVYDVEFDTGGALTLKVQNPADPWELYILRRLASCSPPLAVPLARALYDAESVSYLIMNPYPRSSLSVSPSFPLLPLHQSLDLSSHKIRSLCSSDPARMAFFSAQELVKKRSLGPELLAFYVAKLLETLEALHAAGVIHADVRTETVMISGSNIDDAGATFSLHSSDCVFALRRFFCHCFFESTHKTSTQCN